MFESKPAATDTYIKIKQNSNFTLIELLTVAAVIAILISLLLPSLTYIIDNAATVTCKNNLYQTGQLTASYNADNASFYPLTNRITGGEYRKNTILQMVLMKEYLNIDTDKWTRDGQGNFRNYAGSFSSIFKCPQVDSPQDSEAATGLTFQNILIRGDNSGTENDPESTGGGVRIKWSGTRMAQIVSPRTKLLGFDGHCFSVDGSDFGTGKITVGNGYNSYIPGTASFVDSCNITNTQGSIDRYYYAYFGRHAGNVQNVLFFDGHVENANGRQLFENYYKAKREDGGIPNYTWKNAAGSWFNPFIR